MLPFVVGMMTGSVGGGRLISKLGKYRKFPIVGSLLIITSFLLFRNIGIDTSRVLISFWMILLGLGLGLIMPVTTLAVQNSVQRLEMGTATSAVTFFRSIGSSLGAAIFGAILINRLSHHLATAMPSGGHISTTINSQTLNNLGSLPPATLHVVLNAFAQAFGDVFLYAIPFTVLAFIIALFLRDVPLRTSHDAPLE